MLTLGDGVADLFFIDTNPAIRDYQTSAFANNTGEQPGLVTMLHFGEAATWLLTRWSCSYDESSVPNIGMQRPCCTLVKQHQFFTSWNKKDHMTFDHMVSPMELSVPNTGMHAFLHVTDLSAGILCKLCHMPHWYNETATPCNGRR